MIPRIRQVQIRNFKSIGQAVVDLEPFTVFVGANASGKSNFLDSLSFVQTCLTRSPKEAVSLRGGNRIVPRWLPEASSGTGFRFLIELSGGESADYAFDLDWKHGELPQVRHERCHVHGRLGEHVFEIAEGEFKTPIPGIRPQIQPDRLALTLASATDEFRPVYDFLTSMQCFSIVPHAMRFGYPYSRDFLFVSGANAANILLRLSKQSDRRDYDRICQLLSRLVPSVQGIQPSEMRDDQLGIEFSQDVGTNQPKAFEAAEMSDGTLRLLGLLLALYQPPGSSLTAIEEPEATIHPAAAELVLQVLLDAAEERQVLITTHSPDILDAKEISDEQIRVVTAVHGRTAIAPLAQASRQAIRERLYTPGELLRSDELNQDVQAATEAAEHLDLFGEVPAASGR